MRKKKKKNNKYFKRSLCIVLGFFFVLLSYFDFKVDKTKNDLVTYNDKIFTNVNSAELLDILDNNLLRYSSLHSNMVRFIISEVIIFITSRPKFTFQYG